MTYDYEIDLISSPTSTDEIGDSIEVEVKRSVLAGILDYRNKDYYQALSSGLKPSITFAINKYEYDNEKVLEHEGKRHRIIDVFPVKAKDESEFESLALICEAVV
jgi:hypothetical protein